MNLKDIIMRKDKQLLMSGAELKIGKTTWLNADWSTVIVEDAESPQLVLRNINKVYSLKAMPTQIGWFVSCDGKGSLTVSLTSRGNIYQVSIDLDTCPKPVSLPWPPIAGFLNDSVLLSLHFRIEKGKTASLLVHRRLSRADLIAQAQGRGVELGPGPNPQIQQSENVSVEYVEETPIEKWIEQYDPTGKYKAAQADFSKYIIGTAWDLPQADTSLDFIFSSHVFEHLANPIGHLLRWKKKLKPGGSILAVVPDMNGTKDYVMSPSVLSELDIEHELGINAPGVCHYRRWAESRRRGHEVDELMQKGVSIHVHYYTPQSMADLLEECVKRHGFNAYSIIHSQNHKDFYFILQ